jgi:hypothetical protein
MKLAEITEALTTVMPYQWIHSNTNYYEAIFSIGEHKYSVMFSKYTKSKDLPERWEIAFGLIEPYRSMDLTKTGHQFEVMGTIKQILLEFMSQQDFSCITMIARDPSRKLLYPRILKKVFPNWDITISGDTIITQKKKLGFPNKFFRK